MALKWNDQDQLNFRFQNKFRIRTRTRQNASPSTDNSSCCQKKKTDISSSWPLGGKKKGKTIIIVGAFQNCGSPTK